MDVHYRVVFDGQAPPLPLLVLVSHEARHEILESYRNPLQISGVALRQALGAQSVDDTALDTMCDSSRILRFNPECDVLEWMEPRRWVDIFRKPSPLFLAACLSSVRHVSVEYHSRISTELDLLSLAVLDQDQPLKTLTMLSLHSIENRPLDYRCLRYRLAKRSSGPEAILGEEGTAGDVQHILSRHPTCFLTLSQRTQGDGYGGFLHKAHPLINELLARGIRPRGMLLEAETELSSKFAIYEAFDPSDLADEEYISWRVSYNSTRDLDPRYHWARINISQLSDDVGSFISQLLLLILHVLSSNLCIRVRRFVTRSFTELYIPFSYIEKVPN